MTQCVMTMMFVTQGVTTYTVITTGVLVVIVQTMMRAGKVSMYLHTFPVTILLHKYHCVIICLGVLCMYTTDRGYD
jgi:hypothetical protein